MTGQVADPPVARLPFASRWRVGAATERLRAGRAPWALLACVALAALTLLAPSQPTYDPWSWIIWGREVLHLHLSTTYGPSWKPLTVALTTVFALFGGAAPLLWVLTARAGALVGVLFAFRLGRRLAGPTAGAVAAAVLLVAPWFMRNAAMANSEGLQVAFALAAIERALAGRRGTAFWLGVGLGLLRPEAWPFIGLFGAWLVWRDRSRLLGVAAGLAVLPLLWLAPEKLGSGDWLRAAHRAQQPVSGTAADAASPLLTVLREGWAMLGGPLHWALGAALVVALVRRDRRLLALVALVAAWTLLVAQMSASGYSGNARYLVVPAALTIVVAVCGVAGAASALARRLPVARGVGVVAAAALAAVVVTPWITPVRLSLRSVSEQARLTAQLGQVVRRAGGAAALRRCGDVATGAYLVPAVAWQLGLHIDQVHLVATDPGTVLRVRTNPRSPSVPTLLPLAGAPVRTLAFASDWRVVTTCGGRR